MHYGRLAVAVCIAVSLPPAAARASDRGQTLLVALASGSRPGSLPGAAALRRVDPFGDFYTAAVPSTNAAAAIARWRQLPGVLAVQRDRGIRAAQSEFTLCTNPPSSPDTGLIQAIGENGFSAPASTPPIAILDSGIDATRPEFAGRVRSPISVVPGASATVDTDGHGTAVAGAAAASSASVRGASPTSPIIPIKMLAPDGTTTAAQFIAAVDRAVAAGAGVINVSSASPLAGTPAAANQVVQMAIDRAFSRGVIVVAAAGNEGSAAPDVPAIYPHVLAVAATSIDGRRATFSNYGPNVDLSAPGVQITEPAPTSLCPSGYQLVSGTSFSAPAVAGAAALLEAQRPTLSVTQRFELLRRSTTPPPGATAWSQFTGFGMLDVNSALAAPVPSATSAEVNDDVFWVTGARRTGKAALARGATVNGRIDSTKNPLDVFAIHLGQRARITASLTLTGGRASVSLWDPRTGAFDISSGRRGHRLASTRARAQVTLRGKAARKPGTYFLAVQAGRTPPGGSPYRLTVGR